MIVLGSVRILHYMYEMKIDYPFFRPIVTRKGAEQVEGFTGEQHVDALVQTGEYAEYSCWPQELLTPVSNDLDPAKLICLTLNYVTAYALINRVGKLRAEQRVLVQGAGGRMGTAMLDLCRMMDIRAFGTASQGKHELVEGLGGIPIDYRRQDFVEVVNREGGVEMVVDRIGGRHLVRSFKCLRPEGTLVSTSSYVAALGQSRMLEADPFTVLDLWPNRLTEVGIGTSVLDSSPKYS